MRSSSGIHYEIVKKKFIRSSFKPFSQTFINYRVMNILSRFTGKYHLNFQEMGKNHVVSHEICGKLASGSSMK